MLQLPKSAKPKFYRRRLQQAAVFDCQLCCSEAAEKFTTRKEKIKQGVSVKLTEKGSHDVCTSPDSLAQQVRELREQGEDAGAVLLELQRCMPDEQVRKRLLAGEKLADILAPEGAVF